MTDDQEYVAILVVEDDEMIRSTLQELLENEGYQVLTAENGEHAIHILETENIRPNLILLDMFMPIMDGRKFLNRLKEISFDLSESIPIIIISAAGERAMEASKQVNGFIRKPIDLEELLSAVANYCDRKTRVCDGTSFQRVSQGIAFLS